MQEPINQISAEELMKRYGALRIQFELAIEQIQRLAAEIEELKKPKKEK
jgi:hypothetical protein